MFWTKRTPCSTSPPQFYVRSFQWTFLSRLVSTLAESHIAIPDISSILQDENFFSLRQSSVKTCGAELAKHLEILTKLLESITSISELSAQHEKLEKEFKLSSTQFEARKVEAQEARLVLGRNSEFTFLGIACRVPLRLISRFPPVSTPLKTQTWMQPPNKNAKISKT